MALKAFQQNYWNRPSTVVIPPPGPSQGGYPGWQASVVASLFGALWDLGASWWARVVWWVRLLRRIAGLSAGLKDGLHEALDGLERGPLPDPAPPPPRVEIHPVYVPVKVYPKRPKTRVKSLVEFAKRIRRFTPEQQAVLTRTIDLLESPQFPIAQAAVRQTATTLGFSRPEAWVQYSRAIKASPGRAENVFRHIRAHELTQQGARELGSTLSNPTAHLLVELAYHEFAIKGR